MPEKNEGSEPMESGGDEAAAAGTGGSAPADPRLAELDAREAAGDRPGAVEILRALVVERPRDLGLRLRLAHHYEASGQMVLALDQLQTAREMDDSNVDVLSSLGATLGALARYDQADRELKRALRLDPDRADIHLNLGMLLFKRGLYAQAEAALRRATELDADSAVAHFYRGEALNQIGRVDDALVMLERSVALDPRNAKAFYTMGILYDKKNLPQQAESMYRRAREVASA